MKQSALEIQTWPIEKLKPFPNNARTHSDEQVKQIAASIKQWGWTVPILASPDGTIVAGHCRVRAAESLAIDKVPVIVADGWTEAQMRAYVLADNKLAENAGWDADLLAVELDELRDLEFDLSTIGFAPGELNDLIGTPNTGPPSAAEATRTLADRFMIPPFSVFNAREGWWQDRKRAWLALGIKSEVGRGDTPSTSARVGPGAEATYRTIGGTAAPGGSPRAGDGLQQKPTR